MTRGAGVFVMLLALTFAFTIAVGLGIPQGLNLHYGAEYGEDVQAVADAIGAGQAASNTGSSVFTDFTVGAGRSLQAAWHIITNTDAVLILLFGLPRVVANQIELFARILFGLTFLQFTRGVVFE